MNASEKEKINNMSYEELLREWRFTDIGDPKFKAEYTGYFQGVMCHKRDKLKPGEAAKISKLVGWR